MPSADDDRLSAAADAALLDLLRPYGFQRAGAHASHRGARAAYANTCIELTVWADWLEGELDVRLRAVGGPEVPLSSVVDLAGLGRSLSRLPRGTTRAMLEERLRRVGQAVVDQAGDLLACSETAIARLTA